MCMKSVDIYFDGIGTHTHTNEFTGKIFKPKLKTDASLILCAYLCVRECLSNVDVVVLVVLLLLCVHSCELTVVCSVSSPSVHNFPEEPNDEQKKNKRKNPKESFDFYVWMMWAYMCICRLNRYEMMIFNVFGILHIDSNVKIRSVVFAFQRFFSLLKRQKKIKK